MKEKTDQILLYLLKKARRRIIKSLSDIIPEELYLKWLFKVEMGYKLDLNNPKTFNEKLQWLKLYDRKSKYTDMVDKYTAKNWAKTIIGERYIIPTIGIWDSVDEIDFENLPEQFVLKTTHGGGSCGVFICSDRKSLDIQLCKKNLKIALKQNIYRELKEWPYKNIKPRIIAEKYISDNSGEGLKDYKIFTFNGIPKYCQVISGRGGDMCVDYFDKKWQHQPFRAPKTYKFSSSNISQPTNIGKMWEFAEKLAQDTHFARVDFYEVNKELYFGEITFFPTSGFGKFDPFEWSIIFGNSITLPGKCQ